MKTLFFGTSEFAVPSLHAVAEHSRLAGVVTAPDRRAGRGQRLRPSPVKTAALALGVTVYEPTKLRAFASEIAGDGIELFALASYGRILPAELLALPPSGALNVHPSLLPKYRGATPIQNSLLNGDRETGVSIMLMDRGLDTGDIVAQRRVAIEPDENYGELHDRLARIGAELLAPSLERAATGALVAVPQHGEASLTRPLAKEDLVIDWSWPAQRIVDFVRAFSPQPAARVQIGDEMVKLLRAHVDASGNVVIDELIAPNRGRMSGDTFDRLRA